MEPLDFDSFEVNRYSLTYFDKSKESARTFSSFISCCLVKYVCSNCLVVFLCLSWVIYYHFIINCEQLYTDLFSFCFWHIGNISFCFIAIDNLISVSFSDIISIVAWSCPNSTSYTYTFFYILLNFLTSAVTFLYFVIVICLQ